MTDPDIHAIVAHMGTHQKTSLLKLARGERVNKQTLASFFSRGFIREDEDGSTCITDSGSTALRIINEGNTP